MRVGLMIGSMPVDVEDFPVDTKRSVEGALHLVPGTFREVTDGELAWLRTKLGAALQELPEHPAPPVAPPGATETIAAPPPAPEPSAPAAAAEPPAAAPPPAPEKASEDR